MNNIISRIDSFREGYRFLSNFYLVDILYIGYWFPSVEHAFQAAKATTDLTIVPFYSQKELDGLNITTLKEIDCLEARHLGGGLELRNDWEDKKIYIMTELVHFKFTFYPILAGKLIATGSAELIEGNTWRDKFWGKVDGKGRNELGKILMNIRSKLQTIIKRY